MNPNYRCSHCLSEDTIEEWDNFSSQESSEMKEINSRLPEFRKGYEKIDPKGLCCYGCSSKRTSPYVVVNYSKYRQVA